MWTGPPDSWTGFLLGGDADLDGDGRDDGLVHATYAPGALSYAGALYVTPWLGPGTRALEADAVAQIAGELDGDRTGWSMAADDLDGDGFADLVVGAPLEHVTQSRPGKVLVFTGPLSGVLTIDDAALVRVSNDLTDAAGLSVAVGDIDGSGKPDIAIGAAYAPGDAEYRGGAVYLLYDPL